MHISMCAIVYMCVYITIKIVYVAVSLKITIADV